MGPASSFNEVALAAALESKQRANLERVKVDPWFWARHFTRTYDEHWKEKGKTIPYSPFPDKEYLKVLFHHLVTAKRTFIPKSRDMIVSWACMAYAVWLCETRPRTRVVVQAQKEDKVYDLVGQDPTGYARTLYEQQPAWLREEYPLLGETKLARMAWSHGSVLQGVPAGPDQIRQYHPTTLIVDEACFVEDFQSSYETSDPVCKQIIAISSAAPGYFMDISLESI